MHPEYLGMNAPIRLFAKAAALLALNAVAGVALLLGLGWGDRLQPWETDSIFQGNRLDEEYDLLIMGTSRAYLLSRYEANQRALEATLNANVLNLALPAAGGVKPGYAYLDYCLSQGIQPKTLLLCLDPFVFFNEACNENHKFVYFESFRPGFFATLIREDFPWRRLFIYARHKFSLEWILRSPAPLPRFDGATDAAPTPDRIALRMDSLYLEGLQQATFDRYAPYLDRILDRCKREGIAVHIVTLPTQIGPEPGQAALDAYLGQLQGRYTFTYQNWCDAMPGPQLYYDLDHANATGVQRLLDTLLRPLLSS